MKLNATKPSLLIVDDDPLIVDSLAFVLTRDFAVATASSRSEAIRHIQSKGTPDIALVDLGLPPHPHSPSEGFALITDLLAHDAAIRVVVLSGQNDDSNARHARTLGALEFVAKPVDVEKLRRLLLSILNVDTEVRDHAVQVNEPTGLLGGSPPVIRLRAQLKQFAQSPFPVLIEGESGTGKELAAAALHKLSSRGNEPYLALNCASIAPTLVEATLFGHGKGAFTGATGARAGYFEDASIGTLFLDEIGELPLELQPKLLRVLENGEFQRIGETQTRRSSARIVAATNRDLKLEVREGRFRGDLYHRLSVFTLSMPPLRDLGADRWTLFDYFAALYAKQAAVQPVNFGKAARERLDAYQFPGNVRELRNITIRLTAKHSGETIDLSQIENELDVQIDAMPTMLPANTAATNVSLDPLTQAIEHLRSSPDFVLDRELGRWESAYIDAAQKLAGGNFSQAARLLGISRTTLYNRIESLLRQQRK
jgi:two-component system nitrogen regulation response regulator GlnG